MLAIVYAYLVIIFYYFYYSNLGRYSCMMSHTSTSHISSYGIEYRQNLVLVLLHIWGHRTHSNHVTEFTFNKIE